MLLRIKNILGNIINEDQTGFLPGRLMATNIRLLYDILFHTEKNNIPGLLLLIDFAAAFDTVSWRFMTKVLEFFNFGPTVRNWIKLFYTNVESCVIVNGHMSEWFYLQRGCRQGDALSPYLFILCAEILAIMLRNNPNIKGIKIKGKEYIVSQYADDTSLTLDGSSESLQHTMIVLKFYARISGLNINMDKTKVIWFGSRKNSQMLICPEYNLQWENAHFIVLGVKFSTNLSDMVDINYDLKIEETKKLFACWSKRVISPIGKLVVIKTLALAKFNHLFLGIPNPSHAKLDIIQNLFFKFLWNNSPDRVKRHTIKQDHKFGGLKMIDIKSFSLSLKATWLRRLSKMNNKFSHLVESTCSEIKHIYKYNTDYIKQKLNQVINPFWKEVLYSYYKLTQTIKPVNDTQVLSINIWYNPDIKVGGSSVCYKRWLAAGIVFLGDLISEEGHLYTYRQFIANFGINTNFLEYNGFIHAIRRFLDTSGINNLPNRVVNPFIPLGLSIIKKDTKGCRCIYKQLVGGGEHPRSLEKWKNDLINIPNSVVHTSGSIYDIVFKVTKDPSLIWFQYRINLRILGTNYLLKKMNLVAEDTCSLCRNAQETIIHLFWHCDISKHFLTRLFNYIKNKCNIDMVEWTVDDVLFGSHRMDPVINILLLQAKKFIYFNKMKSQNPCFETFKKQIILRYQTERYCAIKNSQLLKFETLWERFKELV